MIQRPALAPKKKTGSGKASVHGFVFSCLQNSSQGLFRVQDRVYETATLRYGHSR